MPGAVPAGMRHAGGHKDWDSQAVGFTVVPGVSVQTAFAMPTLQVRVTL